MLNLFRFFLKQFFASNLIIANILAIIVPMISFFIMTNKELISENFAQIIIILLICSSVSVIDYIFKFDYDSGALEFLLSTNEPMRLVIAKYIMTFLLFFISFTLNAFLSNLFFGVEISYIFRIIYSSVPIILILSSIIILIGTIRIYFEKNNGALFLLIFPLIIAILLLYSVYLQSGNNSILLGTLGVCATMIPLTCFLSSALLVELYNS